MKKLSKEQAEAVQKIFFIDKRCWQDQLIALENITEHSQEKADRILKTRRCLGIEEKISKELAEKIKKIMLGKSCIKDCLKDVSLIEVAMVQDIIDSFTEKTPEEGLAEYRCPNCGRGRHLHLRNRNTDMGILNRVECYHCKACITEYLEDKERSIGALKDIACYQDDWNGGKL